jgi:sugar phosphate isomerase/epimerase
MIRLSAFADEISADPVEQLDCLDQNGIRHIEFRAIHGTNVLDLAPPQHDEFRALLRSRGFGLSALGSPIGKISITEPFEPHLDRFRTALDLAEFYEAPRVRVFSFYIPDGEDPGQYRDEVIRRMTALADLAASRGIVLFLENERRIFGDNAARVLEILDAVHSPALSHAFDPANYLEVGQQIGQAWELLRSRVGHFHVKDYDLKTKKNVPAGQVQGEIPRLIADAVAHGFDGFCTLEPHLLIAAESHGYTGPERFGEAARALKAELDRVGVAYA